MKNIFALSILLAMVSCHKERVTLPADQEKPTTSLSNGVGSELNELNGYLSLIEIRTSKSIQAPGPSKFKSIAAYALFREPGLPLTKTFDRANQTLVSNDVKFLQGVVSIGDLFTGPTQLNNSSGSYYNYSGTTLMLDTLAYPPRWAAEGNKTFRGFNLEVPRGFPQINDTLMLRDTVYAAKGYTLNLTRWASNYDSVMVQVISSNLGDKIVKRGAQGTNVFTFSNLEVLQMWGSGTPQCTILAYNYMNRQHNGKNMLFENGYRLGYRPVYKP